MRPIYEWRGYLVRMLKFTSRLAFTTCQSCQHDNFGMLTKLFHVTLSWSDKVTSCLTQTWSHFHDMFFFSFFAQNFHDMSPSFHNKNQRRYERRGTDSAGLRTQDSQGVLSTLLTMIVACCGDSHVSGRHLPPPDSTPWLMGSVALKLIRSAAVEVSSFLWYPIMGSVIRMVFP